jgi:hypothetical protein
VEPLLHVGQGGADDRVVEQHHELTSAGQGEQRLHADLS